MLKLEAGKRYWMRYGGVSGVLKPNDSNTNIFSDEFFTWTPEGSRFGDGREYDTDLVREYTEPQPLEWKRGIPTEEECRECWIVTGRRGKAPNSGGVVYAPGEVEDAKRLFNVAEGQYWYLPLRIKPVEPPKPKTKTVTQMKYTGFDGEELWTHKLPPASEWTPTGELRTVEVPCE